MKDKDIPESVNVLTECIELQTSKGQAYQSSKSTVKQADYYRKGAATIYDIMLAKMLRIKSILESIENDPKYIPNHESIEDSAKDLINYASFFVAWNRGKIPGQGDVDILNRPNPRKSESVAENPVITSVISILDSCPEPVQVNTDAVPSTAAAAERIKAIAKRAEITPLAVATSKTNKECALNEIRSIRAQVDAALDTVSTAEGAIELPSLSENSDVFEKLKANKFDTEATLVQLFEEEIKEELGLESQMREAPIQQKKQTGDTWLRDLYPHTVIKDYDGFDRDDLEFSFRVKPLTRDEFETSLAKCTIEHV